MVTQSQIMLEPNYLHFKKFLITVCSKLVPLISLIVKRLFTAKLSLRFPKYSTPPRYIASLSDIFLHQFLNLIFSQVKTFINGFKGHLVTQSHFYYLRSFRVRKFWQLLFFFMCGRLEDSIKQLSQPPQT